MKIFQFFKVFNLLTLTLYLVGKLNANSFESVMMTIGGATRFLTARMITNGMRQIIDTYTAGTQSPPIRSEKTKNIFVRDLWRENVNIFPFN